MADRDVRSLTFRCSAQELDIIERAAAEAGLSKSRFVRNAVLDAVGKASHPVAGEPVVLNGELQIRLARGVLLANILTQSRMTDEGREDEFRAASTRALEIVNSCLDGKH